MDINDIWQVMRIKFTVMHTRIHHGQSIRLTGNLPELGNWNKINPLVLREDVTARGTEELVPFSTVVEVKTSGSKTVRFNYSYALFTENREAEWERDPSRILEILPSESYRGQLGNSN